MLRAFPFIFLLAFVSLGIATLRVDYPEPEPRYESSPIIQEAYVWQRIWTPEVVDAVNHHSSRYANLTVLVAEFSWHGQWHAQWFRDPIQHASGKHWHAAIRILDSAAKHRWQPEATQKFLNAIAPLVAKFDTIQIDYDCPRSKLADYRNLLTAFRSRFPHTRLEITCLPDWLNSSDFPALIAPTHRYIMQVHGVSGHGPRQALCDPAVALHSAQQCSNLGKPFLIALPTYRHAIQRNAHGQISDIVSEDQQFSDHAKYELCRADPAEMARLVDQWRHARPLHMSGIIWYRLPVPSDTMNWSPSTLADVMRGQYAACDPIVTVELSPSGAYLLYLENPSGQHIEWPATLSITWKRSLCIGNELLRHYQCDSLLRGSEMHLRWDQRTASPMLAHSRHYLGWFRLDTPADITAKISNRP